MKKRLIKIMFWLLRRLLMTAIIICIAISFSFFYGLSEVEPAEIKGLLLFTFMVFAILIFGNEYRDFEHKKVFKPILDIFSKEVPLLRLFELFMKWLALAVLTFIANRFCKSKFTNYYPN